MFKLFARLILAAAIASVAVVTSAQQQDMMIFPMGIPCTPPAQDLYDNFENNLNEMPMMQGQVTLQTLNGPEFAARMEMFINPDFSTFSIVVFFDEDDMACILTVGRDIQPIVTGDEI